MNDVALAQEVAVVFGLTESYKWSWGHGSKDPDASKERCVCITLRDSVRSRRSLRDDGVSDDLQGINEDSQIRVEFPRHTRHLSLELSAGESHEQVAVHRFEINRTSVVGALETRIEQLPFGNLLAQAW